MKKLNLLLGFILVAVVTFVGYTAGKPEQFNKRSSVRFEHIGINCADQKASADWYIKNLGLVEKWQKDNRRVIYVGDADGHFSMELYAKDAKGKKALSELNLDAFHIAFSFKDAASAKAAFDKAIAAGAKKLTEPKPDAKGDLVWDVQDPFGVNLQLIARKNPYYAHAVKSNIRFEHIGVNVENQMITALWYMENMFLVMPWSKDLKGKNNSSTYRAPYVGDAGDHFSFELYAKPDIAKGSYGEIDTVVSHLAFAVSDARSLAAKMVKGGAKQIGEPAVNTVGDVVIDLQDPWGFNIQLVQRKKAFLK